MFFQKKKTKKGVSATIMSSYNIMCVGEGIIPIFDVHNNNVSFKKPKLATRVNQHPPVHQRGWMVH